MRGTLDTLRNTYNVGEAFHALTPERQALINAAHAAYDAWAHMSRAHFAACDAARALMSLTVPTSRAYVAAYDLWQAIEDLGAQDAQEELIVAVKAPAKCYAEGCGWVGLASSSDCPSCGALGLSPAKFEDVDAYERWLDGLKEREGRRRQRANFDAVADGIGPLYPDEY